jgi:hypothetical protein
MRCFTEAEARTLLKDRLGPDRLPSIAFPNQPVAIFSFADRPLSDFISVSRTLIEAVGPWEQAWWWVATPDTWNRSLLSLYYRLRQASNDHRLIGEAPVHYFDRHEEADLLSFVTVTILNEWRAYLVTSHDYGRILVTPSHTAIVGRSNIAEFDAVRHGLAGNGLVEVLPVSAI